MRGKDETYPFWHGRDTRGSLVSGFAEHTTLHGVNQLAHRGSICRRLVWLAFMLVMAGLLIFSQVTLIQQVRNLFAVPLLELQVLNWLSCQVHFFSCL